MIRPVPPIQSIPLRQPQRICCPKCGMMVLVWDHACDRAIGICPVAVSIARSRGWIA